MSRAALAALLLLAGLGCARAGVSGGVSPADYAAAGVELPAGAAVPRDVIVTDEDGRRVPLGALMPGPAVLVLADYTCATLCGPTLAFAAAALEQSGLAADPVRLLVVGLDPKDTPADAARMRDTHLSGSAVLAVTRFVTADAASVAALTAALGFRYVYDAAHDQFVHPAAAYVLRADGRVSRVLTGFGLSGDDVRLALAEAGEGRIGTLRDRVRLLCSGFDPARGGYTPLVSRLLVAAGLATVALLAGGIGALALAGRRA